MGKFVPLHLQQEYNFESFHRDINFTDKNLGIDGELKLRFR